MKKYPKIVQCDSRGQIVIPKDIRHDLHIDEGTGFWMYSITDEGLLLKKVDIPELEKNKQILDEIESKADKIKLKKSNIQDTVKKYKKTKDGNLEVI
jgi:AbrB family looped-hinge helix DNA binding protein